MTEARTPLDVAPALAVDSTPDPVLDPLPNPQPSPALTSMLARTRWAAIGSALALTLLALAWELWLAPTGRGTLALKALPLVLTLPGLWRGRLRSYRWASLLVWLYVLEALVRATSDLGAGVWLASLELLLALLMFAACAAHVRLRLRAADAPPPFDRA